MESRKFGKIRGHKACIKEKVLETNSWPFDHEFGRQCGPGGLAEYASSWLGLGVCFGHS